MMTFQTEVALRPENLMLKVVVGSRARGLNLSSSDYDYRGVFTLPLAFDWLLEEQSLEHFKGKGKGQDETYDHVRKYCRLLVKPSPEHHEMLWVEPVQATWAGHMLRALRWRLTSKELAYKFAVAAGLLEVERVDEYLQNDKQHPKKLGKGGMVNRGVKYYHKARNAESSEDRKLYETESNKALADAVRRLMVAVQMLRCETVNLDFENEHLDAYKSLLAWKHVYKLFGEDTTQMDETWLFNPECDSTCAVVLPEEQRVQLVGMRTGLVEYELMLAERNWWLNTYHTEMQASRLKDETDSKDLAYFLQYLASAHDTWRRGVEQLKAGEGDFKKRDPFWE